MPLTLSGQMTGPLNLMRQAHSIHEPASRVASRWRRPLRGRARCCSRQHGPPHCSLGLRLTRVKLPARTNAAAMRPHQSGFAVLCSRNQRFSILPEAVRGISSTISTSRGYL